MVMQLLDDLGDDLGADMMRFNAVMHAKRESVRDDASAAG